MKEKRYKRAISIIALVVVVVFIFGMMIAPLLQ